MSARDAVLHDIHRTESQSLFQRLIATRRLSSELALPLSDEDQVVQANDDASPTKWHLAHTTWFFEAFVLKAFLEGYRIFDERFEYCFNSYYESVGARQPRGKRGLLTRPSAEEVRAYREHALRQNLLHPYHCSNIQKSFSKTRAITSRSARIYF